MKRKIVRIEEEKCNGCGLCVPSCAEGALRIVDGKARLVTEKYCDGLGACLGECPRGAISIEEREAEEFDEKAVEESRRSAREAAEAAHQVSELRQWPVQISLVPAGAAYLKGADILVAADCVPFAFPGFHRRLLRGRAVLVGCPKLDDADAYLAKLSEIIARAVPRAITVAHMEVPCCFGLRRLVAEAVRRSGVRVPVLDVTIGVEGDIEREEIIDPAAG